MESSCVKSEQDSNAYVNLMAHPPPAVEKVALHPTNKILRSSSCSSSPDSPLDDPFHDDDDDDEPKCEPSDCKVIAPKSTVEKSPNDVSSSSIEAPPNQVMENPNPNSSASPYRIPASVFERTSQVEWSNESLFSIHGGNMSFNDDQFMWRSGELPCTSSEQMFSYKGDEGGDNIVADMRSRELGLAEAVMKEVIKESEGQVYEKARPEIGASRCSHGSNRSNQSFAFSLAPEKGGSTRIPSSGRASREHVHSQPKPQAKTEPQPSRDPKPKTPISTSKGNATKCKWFSCLPRCSLCL